MDTEELNRLIEKYLANTITEEERERLNNWYSAFNDEQVEIPVSEETTEEEVFSGLYNKIEKKIQHRGEKRKRKVSPLFIKVAASISLLAILSYVLFQHSAPIIDWLYPVKYVEQRTPAGQWKVITLTDGTRITLNVNSWLRYPKVFNRSTREVYLEGEAFFEVAENKEKPFKIHTRNVVTTVLGTSFNVKAPSAANQLSVTVLTGKVRVAKVDSLNITQEKDGEQVLAILLPHDELTYDVIADISRITNNVEQSSIAPWKEGILEFRSITLDELVQQLEGWYGADIRVVDSTMAQCKFTGSFKELSLTRVLDLLATSNGFTYEQRGATITIKGGVACKN